MSAAHCTQHDSHRPACPWCRTADRDLRRATTTWHLATCQDCQPVLPQPFRSEQERDEWAGAHTRATEHRVALS